jgi:hypothetical protein
MAWAYLGEKMNSIRPLGIRGAFDMKSLIDDLDRSVQSPDAVAAKKRAEEALKAVSSALGIAPECVQIVFRKVGNDPYTVFLQRTAQPRRRVVGDVQVESRQEAAV